MRSIFILIFVVTSTILHAQTRVVTGTVSAFKDMYLKNIHVKAKKTKSIVKTDSMGRFSVVCDKNDRLTFSGNGFQNVVRRTNNKNVINVKMVFNEGTKNEEIAVGYGHISKEKLTYAIANLSDYNNDFCNYNDIFALMQGKFSGVQIVNKGGEKNVLIRGVSSNSDNIYAIYIVDGVAVNDISYITPSTVKSISVLKDGGSIYGVRGANGVVLITTVGH